MGRVEVIAGWFGKKMSRAGHFMNPPGLKMRHAEDEPGVCQDQN